MSQRLAKLPRLLLFDVDGTLIRSEKANIYKDWSPILNSINEVFNTNITKKGIEFGGLTDRLIIRKILDNNNINSNNTLNFEDKIISASKLTPYYHSMAIKKGIYNFIQLNNVNKLLAILNSNEYKNEFICGLLTGNVIESVPVKLNCAGVNLDYFTKLSDGNYLGSFGSDSENRNNLIGFAKQRYAKYLNIDINNINSNDLIIIGDTPKDIECAHVNNVPCIAVTTGVFNRLQLKSAECVLDGFDDIQKTIYALRNTIFNQNTSKL